MRYLTALLILSAVLQMKCLSAQVPGLISYQAIVRNNTGQLVANQQIRMRITIIQGAPDGIVVYTEIITSATNANGLVTAEIGKGAGFEKIDWSNGPWYIRTETDPTGGSNFTISGTHPLMAVPVAFYAKTASQLTGTITESQISDLKTYVVTESDPTWTGAGNDSADIARKGRVGIGVEEPAAMLHVRGTGLGEGNIIFEGEYKGPNLGKLPGNPPMTNSGTRMFWYPDKAAFRAGTVLHQIYDDIDSIGTNSIALGEMTLASGSSATALGAYSNASGVRSTAIGSATIASGGSSTAMGLATRATEWASTALGFETIASNKTSLATGFRSRASGNGSTAMGSNTIASSGFEFVIGLFNTSYTPISSEEWISADRLFVVGNGAAHNSRSDAMVILKNGNTGIGSSAPESRLHLRANAWTKVTLEQDESLFKGYLGSDNQAAVFSYNTYFQSGWRNDSDDAAFAFLMHRVNQRFEFRVRPQGGTLTTAMVLNVSGDMGIGTTSPTERIDINGNARIRSIASGAYAGPVNRTSNGTLTTATSDERLKSNILPLQNSLDKTLQLQGVSFTWTESPEMGERIGFIAQEVQKILPQLVFTNETDGYKGVNYAELTAVLVEAMKEQQHVIEELRTQINQILHEKSLLQTSPAAGECAES
jgi:hypothetical protein